jgi:hypothetical protein
MTDCDPEQYYTFGEIYPQTGGIITVGYETWRHLLSSILLKLPAYVVDAVLRNCLFIMPNPEDKGSFIPNRIIKNRHIIHFPNSLLGWPEDQQVNIVLHQIAHYVLRHWSPLEECDADFNEQAQDAADLVNQWMVTWSNAQGGGLKQNPSRDWKS